MDQLTAFFAVLEKIPFTPSFKNNFTTDRMIHVDNILFQKTLEMLVYGLNVLHL